MKIVSIVGKKNTGKTTLSTKIIRELTKRGYKVASIKHSHHTIEMDKKNTDTWKHKQAGSEIVTGIGSTTFFNIKQNMDPDRILYLIKHLDNIDYVIIEGFKKYNYPKIATSPDAVDEHTIKQINPFTANKNEIEELIDLIEKRSHDIIKTLYKKNCGYTNGETISKEIIKGNIKTETLDYTPSCLSVNNNIIGLNRFVSDYIKQNILGIIKTLNLKDYGVEEISKIELIINNEKPTPASKIHKSKIHINRKKLKTNSFTENLIMTTVKGAVDSIKTDEKTGKIEVKITEIKNSNLKDATITLKINEKKLNINHYAGKILKESIFAMINTLNTDEQINEILIEMEVEND